MLQMKHLIYLSPLALCPVVAQVVDARSACMAALDAEKKAQTDNIGAVVSAVLDATGGDEQAFGRLMREAADAGHPVALTWLARQNLRQLRASGKDLSTAPEAAKLRAVVETAAAQGYVPAVVELSHCFGSGVGAPPDEDAGMKHLMEACKANSARARAAYLLLSGRLEKEGDTGAATQAELQKNNHYVEEFLALLSPDTARSIEWLTRAASHGSSSAAHRLAGYYLQAGKALQGYEFLKQAVDGNQAESMSLLASWMLPGAAVPAELQKTIKPDTEAAIRLFQRAALQGYTPALIPLAGEYHKQPEKYPAERVFELYRLAADSGDARGGVAYAYCLVAGRGCAAEPERGLSVLNQLVDAGVPFANLALADLYFNGCGVEADMAKAISCLTSAASMGVPQSYTLMAVISQLGNADKASDPLRARTYLRMAQERGELAPQQAFDALVKAGAWKFMP